MHLSVRNVPLQAMIDYLIAPAGGTLPAGGKVQEFQSPMRTDFHLPGLGGSNGGARKGLHDLYAPKPGSYLPLVPLKSCCKENLTCGDWAVTMRSAHRAARLVCAQAR